MRTKSFGLIFVLVLLLPHEALKAQPPAQSIKPIAATSVDLQLEKLGTEITVLREQNKLIRDYHGSLLDTVYWAFGGVFTLTVLLAGFGWWSNFKVYESDKKRLQEEFASRLAELEARLALRVESNKSELERIVDAKSEAHLNRVSSEMGDVRTQLASLDTKANVLHDELRKTSESVGEKIDKARKSIANTKSELRHVEEYIWDLRGVPQNVLVTQSQGLEDAIEAQSSGQIRSVLSRIKSTIETEFISKGVGVDKFAFDSIKDAVVTAGKINGIQVTELLEVLGKVEVIE